MTQAKRKRKMILRFEQGISVPRVGDTVRMQGSFGSTFYDVHITYIRKREQHPDDGATLLTVDARVKPAQRQEES